MKQSQTKKGKTVFHTVMQPLVVLILLQAAILLTFLYLSGIFDQVNSNERAILSKQVANRANYLESQMTQQWADIGALAASIKAGAVKYSAADGYYCEVAPTGTNAEGENLAKIGNILEYGRSNMPARPWFAPTVDSAAEEVNSAIRETFQAAQGKE